MRFQLALTGALIIASLSCTSQTYDSTQFLKRPVDSTKTRKVRRTHDYFSVQANQLLNQLFNFGNSSSAVSNPYMFLYSANSIKTGWGMSFGFGLNLSNTSDDSDPNVKRKFNSGAFNVRAGLDKKSYLSKRWLLSTGLDLVYSHARTNSYVSTDFQGNVNTTDTKNSTGSYGFGPRAGLNFFVTDRILLGTEINYYLRFSKTKSEVKNTNSFQGQVNESTTKTDQDGSSLTFTSPVAIFLTLKL